MKKELTLSSLQLVLRATVYIPDEGYTTLEVPYISEGSEIFDIEDARVFEALDKAGGTDNGLGALAVNAKFLFNRMVNKLKKHSFSNSSLEELRKKLCALQLEHEGY